MSPGDEPRRERLDVVLVQRGLASTRAKAQALVLAGRVLSEGTRLDKPGRCIPARWVASVGSIRRPMHLRMPLVLSQAAWSSISPASPFGLSIS